MHKAVFTIVLALALTAAISFADDFTIAPFLTNATTTSVDICFQSEQILPASIQYGATQEYGNSTSITGEFFQANWGVEYPPWDDPSYTVVDRYAYCGRIEGLLPDTLYHYSVNIGGMQTPDNVFATAPEAGMPLSFIVYGDSRSDPLYPLGTINMYHQRVIESMEPYSFDFFMNVGDIVNDGHDIHLWDIVFETIEPVSSNIPYYPIFGNHDRRSEGTVRGTDVYSMIFSNPGETSGSGNELYYSFDYGNVHFTVLDTNADISTDSQQNLWLRADLEAANGNPDIRWKFVAFHHPPYSSSLFGIGDERQVLARQYLPEIMQEYGVDIVFAGHQHSYERSFKDGVFWVVTGNGGALPSFLQLRELNPFSQVFEGNADFSHFGFCHIEIVDDYLILRSIIADDTVIDAFTIGGPLPGDDDDDDTGFVDDDTPANDPADDPSPFQNDEAEENETENDGGCG